MSRFVSMTKYLSSAISRALTLAAQTIQVEESQVSSGFSRWRYNYERFCKRIERQRFFSNNNKSLQKSLWPSKRFVCCRKRRNAGSRQNITSMFSGVCMARLLSIDTHQAASTMPLIYTQSTRTKCGRENCADPCVWPLCPPGNKTWYRPKNERFNIYEAYWEERNENCCLDNCKWANTRFDDIYYRENDKNKRMYNRTWYECPTREVVKRKCCYDGTPPDFCKREKKDRPETACNHECEAGSCPKFTLPCCCPVRKKLTCKPIVRGLQDCKRFCAPYPSYSECRRKRPLPLRQKECPCLRMPMTCEMNEAYRRLPSENRCAN